MTPDPCRARLRFGAAVEEKREEVRETLEAERVRVVEQWIEARNREEEERKQREEEERKQRERSCDVLIHGTLSCNIDDRFYS